MEYFLDERNFAGTPYKVDKVHDQLYIIHEFLTEDERIKMLEYAQNATQSQWQEEYLGNLKIQMMQKYGEDDLDKLSAEGKVIVNKEWADRRLATHHAYPEETKNMCDRVNQFFGGQELFTRSLSIVQRHRPGEFMVEHVDNNYNPNLIFAGVAYLNDDYNGGELYFRKLNIRLKPPARSLALFSTKEDYIHGIESVLEGPTRYAMPCFIWTDDSSI
jgi:hypothetical protein